MLVLNFSFIYFNIFHSFCLNILKYICFDDTCLRYWGQSALMHLNIFLNIFVYLTLTLYFILKNDQTYFKNLTVFTPQDFWSMFSHFSTWNKGLTNFMSLVYFYTPCKHPKNSEFLFSVFRGYRMTPVTKSFN